MAMTETQIKATIRCQSTPIRMAKVQNKTRHCDNATVVKNAEKLDPSSIAGGMQNGTATLENKLAVYLKGKHATTVQLSNCRPGHLSQRIKTSIHIKIHTQMLAALSLIAPNWKHPDALQWGYG